MSLILFDLYSTKMWFVDDSEEQVEKVTSTVAEPAGKSDDIESNKEEISS